MVARRLRSNERTGTETFRDVRGITMKILMTCFQDCWRCCFLSISLCRPLQQAGCYSPSLRSVMEEYKHRDYEAALAGFRFFLELHGQSSLAPNAQYWMGECQYRLGRYKEP